MEVGYFINKKFFVILLFLGTITLCVMCIGLFVAKEDVRTSGGQKIYDRMGVELSVDASESEFAQILNEISKNEVEGNILLSIDAELQSEVQKTLSSVANDKKYQGGAGAIMDIETGELLVLTSFPEYSEEGLNKATEGLYIPGSIIKPFVAIAALSEGIVDTDKKILSTGSIELVNPTQDGSFYTFKDWKSHGYVDMREAIGVSSNVYFYAIGGGFEDQPGVGIESLEKYLRMFGIAEKTGIENFPESIGNIPNPAWKEEVFRDEWRIADTYMASIGQHGYEVTPLQMLRATAAIANKGRLVTPTITSVNIVKEQEVLPINKDYFETIHKGMEYAVMNGTAAGLYIDDFSLAAKTGTAEVGTGKDYIHSWIVGYFPHDKPLYAFVFMLESGPWGEEIGATTVSERIVKWIRDNRTEYYKN